MFLGFPILFLQTAVRYFPFGYLTVVMIGVGVILIAVATLSVAIHFRRLATSVIATVTRERRLVENYFMSEQTRRSQKQPTTTKLPTIEVQFTTQIGERITLELLAHMISPEMGQTITIFYLPSNPQVASINPRNDVRIGIALAVLYCLFGAALITAGVALFR